MTALCWDLDWTIKSYLILSYSASSLKQRMGRHIATLGHIIQLFSFRTNQSLLLLLIAACLEEKHQISIV